MKLFQAFGRKREPAPEPPARVLSRWINQKAFNRGSGHDATPSGYTWHYVEDGKTKQLVPRDLHRAIPHSGGVAAIKSEHGHGLL
jgi:hypothetical protein